MLNIGWPFAALIFGIVFIVLFHKPIREFISRIKSVSKEGLTTENIPRTQNDEQRQQAVEELMKLADSTVILEVESMLKAELQQHNLETESDSAKVLLRHLAATTLALDFEQIYSQIFGSQIFLLKKLNEVVGQGLDLNFLQTYFAGIQTIHPEELGSWSFDQYLAFILGRNLIVLQDGMYHITVKGQEYLVWMVRTGHREDRPW